MKKLLLILMSIACLNTAMSQQKNPWVLHTSAEKIITDKGVARLTFPKEFKLFDLNINELSQVLYSIVDNKNGQHTAVISLPNAKGNMEEFEVVEASNFEPALQKLFPEIRAFSGRGLTDKYATLKLSLSPQGIQTMVFRTEQENEFIEPYSQDHTIYAVFVSKRTTGGLPWNCSTIENKSIMELNTAVAGSSSLTARSGGDVKTLRLAQSVTAEYSNYFGATSSAQVSLVLAGINATLTRCNGVYEKDLALHLNLISNTTSVIYYTASTDPYDAATTGAGGTWNAQLQSTLTSVIGDANYDIGHLFGASGGGGNAGCIGCVCTNGSKGSGFTSPADGIPQGDNFDIDYVVHEVGHQLGGNHTFSMSNEGTGVNKEIGSGITIMGYAGITSQDVAPHSIDIYHEATIAQIQTNIGTKTCPVTTSISANNATPVVAAVSNYTIPISTPFALTGSATDANSDPLTYCWEQNDNASSSQTGTSSVASITKATGPNWISFKPTTSPTRYFPQLSTILAGANITGPLTGGDAGTNIEALSSVARTLNFRLTVRDNCPYSSTAPVKVGQTSYTDMVVTVSSASGPFAVTAPNTAVSYVGGSTQNITWSVANTTATPVSCANVKISLSTDGGLTFPTVLAASTPNDGTESLVIPNTPTTTARIKVEAVGNIFFDISNANFTITSGSTTCAVTTGLVASSITSTSATLGWTTAGGATSYNVRYKKTADTTWTSTTSTTNSLAISGLVASTSYDFQVQTVCTSGTVAYSATTSFTTSAVVTCGTASGLAASAIASTTATLGWTAVSGASSYNIQYRKSGTTAWTSTTSTTNSKAISGLTASTLYEFQVQTVCTGGNSTFTASATFTTLAATTTCNAPTGLATTGITSTGATLSWTAVTGAASYGVDYKKSTATTWTSLATATTTTTASLTGLTASTAYNFRVRTNCSGGTTSSYTTANFSTIAATACSSVYDTASNGTRAGAKLIPFNTNITGLINPVGDTDFYKFTITTAGTITVTLTTLPADFDLKIVNSAGTVVASSASASTTSETINYTAAAGTYYAQVFGYSGAFNASTCYTLKVQLGTATRQENFNTESIVNTSSVGIEFVKVYPNPTHDYLSLSFNNKVSNNALYSIIDAKGNVLSTQKVVNKSQTIDLTKLSVGVYLIKVIDGDNTTTERFIKQ